MKRPIIFYVCGIRMWRSHKYRRPKYYGFLHIRMWRVSFIGKDKVIGQFSDGPLSMFWATFHVNIPAKMPGTCKFIERHCYRGQFSCGPLYMLWGSFRVKISAKMPSICKFIERHCL